MKVLNDAKIHEKGLRESCEVAQIVNKAFTKYVYFYTWIHKKAPLSKTLFSRTASSDHQGFKKYWGSLN